MANQLVQTDTDTDRHQTSEWRLIPMHSFPVLVTPPSLRVNLHLPSAVEIEMRGGFELVWGTRATTINGDIHNSLLEESLREYEEIWRSLAQK